MLGIEAQGSFIVVFGIFVVDSKKVKNCMYLAEINS